MKIVQHRELFSEQRGSRRRDIELWWAHFVGRDDSVTPLRRSPTMICVIFSATRRVRRLCRTACLLADRFPLAARRVAIHTNPFPFKA